MFHGTSSHACSPTSSTKKSSWNFPFVGTERQKSPLKRPGFVRLDSVGSEMTVNNLQSFETRASKRFEATKHSPSERRWFGRYHQSDSFSVGGRSLQHHIQIPYNLNKYQFEPMSVLQHSNSCPAFEQSPQTIPSPIQHSATSIDVSETNQQNQFGSFFNRLCQATMATVGIVTSTLNPNARSFTPLNPNAKEFTPTASPSEQHPSMAFGCREVEEANPCHEKTMSEDSAVCSAATSHNSTSSEEEGKELEISFKSADDFTPERLPESIKKIEVYCNSSVGSTPSRTSEKNLRPRTWSSCSDDSVVEFLPSDQNNSAGSCDTDTSDDEDEESDDDFSDESDGDSDWDEVDASDIRDDDIPEELLNCGLFCPSAFPSTKTSENKPTTTSDLKKNELSETIDDHERYPVNQYEDQVSTAARLVRINADWDSMYSDVPAGARKPGGVRFDVSTDREYEEDPEMSQDLHEARKSDLPQRKADKMRMERLLAPIFDPMHREKIYAKLHGN